MQSETGKEFYYSVSRSIGSEKAIKMSKSGWWEGMEPKKAALIALTTRELCLPFDQMHRIVEEACGRPVWTHEFALNFRGIYLEVIGEGEAPTFEEICNMIPEEKRVIIQL